LLDKEIDMSIKPSFPSINSSVFIFGVRAYVSSIEPESDWTWRVNLASVNALGGTEEWHVIVPTDYRTEDGFFIGDGNTAFVQPECACGCGEEQGEPNGDDLSPEERMRAENTAGGYGDLVETGPCGLCGEPLDDESAEFIRSDRTRVMAHGSCGEEHGLTQA
jgi:hypothetical protein